MTVKIGVSLPDEQVAAARRAVAEGRAHSVSTYIAEAIARREQTDSLTALLDDLDRELGEPTAADYAWADKALGLA
jgi:Arc/MetJ-type ribon-helix-helix transcriptional regulator